MKTGKYHIIFSWILLICFIAGQYMVYAHQHNITKGVIKACNVSKHLPQQTVKEKCSLCDVMHHNVMVAANHVYFSPAIMASHVYKSVKYTFINTRLILSGGRAPPVTNNNS